MQLPILDGSYPLKICLTFWYRMSGSDIGDLVIYTLGSLTEVFHVSGDQGDLWLDASADIILSSPQKRVFKVHLHKGHSNLALPDYIPIIGISPSFNNYNVNNSSFVN